MLQASVMSDSVDKMDVGRSKLVLTGDVSISMCVDNRGMFGDLTTIPVRGLTLTLSFPVRPDEMSEKPVVWRSRL